jgi:Skp family chaperone for outer membrane proteins
MKALLWMSGLIVTVASLIAFGSVWAKDQNKADTPRTRIGLVNLTSVIKNYRKYRDFQEEIKDIVGPFQTKDAALRKQLEKLRAEAESLSRDANNGEESAEKVRRKKEALEAKARQVQRQMEDNTAEAKLKLGGRSDEEMKELFHDVEEAVKRYARSHDLDVVLHYNDVLSREEYYSAQNAARKFNTGGLMPLSSVPGIDITNDIADLLNYGQRKEQ